MNDKPRIAIVIGSTRPGRYADKAANWMLKQAAQRGDIDAELLDLRDHPLPFFYEKGPLISVTSENPEARRWQEALTRFDGFVFVVAEYNHSVTGVLKNALDQAYHEWGRKPFTAIGYGGMGAARAVEQLRLIAIPLRMVSTAATIHIAGADFFATSPLGEDKPIEAVERKWTPTALPSSTSQHGSRYTAFPTISRSPERPLTYGRWHRPTKNGCSRRNSRSFSSGQIQVQSSRPLGPPFFPSG